MAKLNYKHLIEEVKMDIFNVGICTNMNCFDSDELQEIYKQVIKLCKFCINCH